ncbi:MAG: pyruvate kinase [Candidatus Krumholzibacteriota bacterium]|nr:pyruvate kinase [Candidatus Krumholzibacteriota bacterium]
MKRAKIVCTIGPASRDEETLKRLIDAGMNVARMNFSHGEHAEHLEVYDRIRKIDDSVAIMQDLQGPKIRVGIIESGEMMLGSAEEITLTTGDKKGPGKIVPVTYSHLPDDVVPGNSIFLNDGLIQLEVLRVEGREVRCKVLLGGILTSRKGVNLPGVRVSSPALTEKDREDLEFGLDLGVDYVALSFVRRAEEVRELKHLIDMADSSARVVSKIEKREALESIDEILDETDAVMIARGDLGVEIPTEEVPVIQKSLIEMCLAKGKPVITATQMLESMVNSKRPTRAEASDVANAVIDGTDAIMLSAETATGHYPVETVEVMSRIAEAAEKYKSNSFIVRKDSSGFISDEAGALTDAIASGVAAVARDVGASAIAVLTHGGQTARLIARRRPEVPIIALTDFLPVVRQMSLVWGVEAIPVESIEETETIFSIVKEKVRKAGYKGRVVMTAGIPTRERRPSNTIHVIDI